MEKVNLYESRYDYDFFYTHNMDKMGGSNDRYHFHDSYEIYLSLTEKGEVRVNDKYYELHYGDLFIINNLDMHKFIIPPEIPYERHIIMFSPHFVKGISTQTFDILGLFNYDPVSFFHRATKEEYETFHTMEELLECFENIKRIYKEDKITREIELKIEFSRLLLKLNNIYTNISIPAKDEREDEIEKIQEILKYINNNISSDLSLEILSKKFYISKFYLSHYFKKCMGISLGKFVIKCRIEYARRLLKNNINVYTVCEEVGFNNYSHFIRTFKQYTGFSPKKYSKTENFSDN